MFLFLNPLSNLTPYLREMTFLLKALVIGGFCLILINFINLIVNICKKR